MGDRTGRVLEKHPGARVYIALGFFVFGVLSALLWVLVAAIFRALLD
jgi:hypothetical protein